MRALQGPRVSAGTPLQIWGPLVALWLVWGSTYLAIAVTTQTMPPLLSAAMRFLAAAALLGVGLIVFKGIRVLRVSVHEVAFSGLMGVMLLGVGIGTVSLAEQHIPSGVAALLVSVNALWVVLLRVRAGQRPSRLTVAGVAVGIVGLAFMLLPGGPPSSQAPTATSSSGRRRCSSVPSHGPSSRSSRRATPCRAMSSS